MIIYLITGFLEQSVLVIYVKYIKFLHLFHIYIYIYIYIFFFLLGNAREGEFGSTNLELLHDDDDNDINNNHHHHITITMNTVK